MGAIAKPYWHKAWNVTYEWFAQGNHRVRWDEPVSTMTQNTLGWGSGAGQFKNDDLV
jgi:hypothetical protein